MSLSNVQHTHLPSQKQGKAFLLTLDYEKFELYKQSVIHHSNIFVIFWVIFTIYLSTSTYVFFFNSLCLLVSFCVWEDLQINYRYTKLCP